jgi:hypothetical protein
MQTTGNGGLADVIAVAQTGSVPIFRTQQPGTQRDQPTSSPLPLNTAFLSSSPDSTYVLSVDLGAASGFFGSAAAADTSGDPVGGGFSQPLIVPVDSEAAGQSFQQQELLARDQVIEELGLEEEEEEDDEDAIPTIEDLQRLLTEVARSIRERSR